jgi:hypothetical protein
VNVAASIAKDRTSRLTARQTDSSSSTIAISGLDLLKAIDLSAVVASINKIKRLIVL